MYCLEWGWTIGTQDVKTRRDAFHTLRTAWVHSNLIEVESLNLL